MAEHTPVSIDENEVQRANDMWGGFVKGGKIATYIAIVCLALLALGFYAVHRA